MTATCYFVSHSDFTAINVGKIKDGAKSTVKSDSKYVNKFSAGCFLAGAAQVVAATDDNKTNYAYFGIGMTAVNADKTGGDLMEGG